MTEKTHYRTFSNSKHLASDDLIGLDYISLTINKAFTGSDENKKKVGPVPIITFKEKQIRAGEKLKSMILNMTNMKTLEDITGSPYLEDWSDVKIEIYVDNNVRFKGDVVDGLRIRKPPQQVQRKVLGDEDIPKLIASIKKGSYSFERLNANYEVTQAQLSIINEKLNEVPNAT